MNKKLKEILESNNYDQSTEILNMVKDTNKKGNELFDLLSDLYEGDDELNEHASPANTIVEQSVSKLMGGTS